MFSSPIVQNTNHAQTSRQNGYEFAKPNDCGNRLTFLIIGVVLTAVAAVATYFSLVNGLTMLDTAFSSLTTFGAGFLIYSGVVFSFVAVINALYVGGKLLCHDENTPFEYTPNEAKIQIGLSIFAPIAAIPVVIIFALSGVFSSR